MLNIYAVYAQLLREPDLNERIISANLLIDEYHRLDALSKKQAEQLEFARKWFAEVQCIEDGHDIVTPWDHM